MIILVFYIHDDNDFTTGIWNGFFAVMLWSCKSIFRSDLIQELIHCVVLVFALFLEMYDQNDVSRNYRQIIFLMNDKPLSAQSKSSLFEALWQAIKMFWSFKSASNLGTLNLENKSVELLGPNACKNRTERQWFNPDMI